MDGRVDGSSRQGCTPACPAFKAHLGLGRGLSAPQVIGEQKPAKKDRSDRARCAMWGARRFGQGLFPGRRGSPAGLGDRGTAAVVLGAGRWRSSPGPAGGALRPGRAFFDGRDETFSAPRSARSTLRCNRRRRRASTPSWSRSPRLPALRDVRETGRRGMKAGLFSQRLNEGSAASGSLQERPVIRGRAPLRVGGGEHQALIARCSHHDLAAALLEIHYARRGAEDRP